MVQFIQTKKEQIIDKRYTLGKKCKGGHLKWTKDTKKVDRDKVVTYLFHMLVQSTCKVAKRSTPQLEDKKQFFFFICSSKFYCLNFKILPCKHHVDCIS